MAGRHCGSGVTVAGPVHGLDGSSSPWDKQAQELKQGKLPAPQHLCGPSRTGELSTERTHKAGSRPVSCARSSSSVELLLGC